jgi:dUTP pyrophosphatase
MLRSIASFGVINIAPLSIENLQMALESCALDLRISLMDALAIPPTRGSTGSAGYDLYSVSQLVIPSRGRAAVKTGVVLEIPSNTLYGRIAPRSGLAIKHGINVLGGVVDSDYRGEVVVLLHNTSEDEFTVTVGMRIAQIIFEKIWLPLNIKTVHFAKLDETARGDGGFGSTGV